MFFQYALSRKLCGSSEKKSHWLEYADDKFDVGFSVF